MAANIINIGILTPFLEGNYYGKLINSIHDITKELGYRLFVIQTTLHKKPSVPSNYGYLLAVGSMDGWIVLPQAIEDSYLDILLEENKPVVLISRQTNNNKCLYILSDNFYSTKQATEHMIKHGHKQIAFAGCFNIADVRDRFDGYLAALKEHNISFDSNLVYDVSDALQLGGREAAEKIIESGFPCTAVIAGTDTNAFGMIEVLKEEGYRIPDDIAIFGYDDNDFSKTITPSLSTIHQNINEVGCMAVKSLIKEITAKSIDPGTIFVKSDLVIRQSCGCAQNITPDNSGKQSNTNNKDSKSINQLIKTIINSYKIINNFPKSSFNEIQSLKWLDLTSYNWGCLGLWDETQDTLYIDNFYSKKNYLSSEIELYRSLRNFPPVEFLPDTTHSGGNDVVWLTPINTDSSQLGVIALVGPISKSNFLANCDTMSHCLEMLSFILERELQKKFSEKNGTCEMGHNLCPSPKKQYVDIIIQKRMFEWFLEDLSILKKTSSDSFFDTDNPLYRNAKKIEKTALSILSPVEYNIFLLELAKLKLKNIRQLFKQYSEYTLDYSKNLNKYIQPFSLQGKDILVDPDIYNDFLKSLIHVFRTMLDYSVEGPDERLQKGKNEYGIIICKTDSDNNTIYIELSDDGKGLKENSFTAFSEVEKECTKLGGKFEVESKEGYGTTFRFTLPYQKAAVYKTITPRRILDPIIRKTADLLGNDYGLRLSPSNCFTPKKTKKIAIKDITTTLDISGILNCKLIITVNEKLGKNLFKKFILEELTPESELALTESVLCECLNIIVGNSIQYLDEDLDTLLTVETPLPIKSKNCFLIFPKSETWTYNMAFDEGALNIGFVHYINKDIEMCIG